MGQFHSDCETLVQDTLPSEYTSFFVHNYWTDIISWGLVRLRGRCYDPKSDDYGSYADLSSPMLKDRLLHLALHGGAGQGSQCVCDDYRIQYNFIRN